MKIFTGKSGRFSMFVNYPEPKQWHHKYDLSHSPKSKRQTENT